ncbi:MAG: autotransporter-associated beta strand repeat-containing protein [Opitutales bacterium]|jgi:autotransporter-associated beta strand protein
MTKRLHRFLHLPVRVLGLCILALASGAFLSNPARAQTWTGAGGDGNWNTNANWNTGAAPFYTDSPYYPLPTANVTFDGSTSTTVNDNATPTNYVNSLGFASTASAFTINNGTIGITGNLFDNSSNTQTINSNLTFVASQTWNVSAGKLVLNGILSDAYSSTLTKTGSGELDLNGNNTFTGPTVIAGGIVNLGNSNALGAAVYGNQVNTGATLELNGGISVNQSGFSFNGTGTSNNGALLSSGGNNLLGGQIVLGSASTFQVSAGSLTLNGSLQLPYNLIWTGSGNGTISGAVTGTGGLIDKTGTGTLTFTGNSGISNSGGLQIDGGTVILNQTAGAATWNGPIVVGNNTSAVGTSTLLLDQGNQIANSLSVTVNNSGIFNLNGNNQTIASVTMTGGSIQTGAGVLGLSSASSVTTNASGNIATITGNLQLQAYSSNFTIARGTASTDLAVNAVISASSAGNIVKAGSGILSFGGTAANTFAGTVTVSAGTLVLDKTAGVNAIAGSGIIISTGGTLLLGASNQISSSTAMTLSGGTFAINGFSEGSATSAGLGTLTLSSSSTLNLSSTTSVVAFSNSQSTSGSWASGQTLAITGWNGSLTGGGTDRIYFGTSTTGLTSTQLSEIQFIDPTGLTAGDYGARLLSTGEIVPFVAVPEPGTTAAGAALVLLVSFEAWRRRPKILLKPAAE